MDIAAHRLPKDGLKSFRLFMAHRFTIVEKSEIMPIVDPNTYSETGRTLAFCANSRRDAVFAPCARPGILSFAAIWVVLQLQFIVSCRDEHLPEDHDTVNPAGIDDPKSASSHPVKRSLGLFFLGLGTLGIGVPLLPTVPFWILAAVFFAGSSPSLQRRIYAHPQFGDTVRTFVEQRALTRRSKIISIVGASGGACFSLAITRPPVFVVALVAMILLPTMLWLATRPAPGVPQDP